MRIRICTFVFSSLVLCSVLSIGKANAQSPVLPDIYFVDRDQAPGRISEIDPSRRNNYFSLSLTWEALRADPNLISIALYDQDSAYYVRVNGKEIVKTDGYEKHVVYTHNTYIRDIAFDADGYGFFSEYNGTDDVGRIFVIGYRGKINSGDNAEMWKTIQLEDIGGNWDGNFEFDPSNKLFLSTGSSSPASIYEVVGDQFVQRFSQPEPVLGIAFLSTDQLLFTSNSNAITILQNFRNPESYFRNTRVNQLSDVDIITSYDPGECSISGSVHNIGDLWDITSVQLRGPGAYWRFPEPSSQRLQSNGSYEFSNLLAGRYWMTAEVLGDEGSQIDPFPHFVRCVADRRIVNQDFRKN